MKKIAFGILALALLGASAPSKDVSVTVTVSGQGTVNHAADTALLDAAIVTNDDDAQKATSENNSRYNDLRNRLHALGIADSAIRTTSYNVNFVPPQPMLENQHPMTGYVVNRSLQITMTDLNLVGPSVDAAIAAKIGEVYNVQFTISNYRELYAQALKAAMQDAQRQALALAQASNMHIVRISQIQSGGFYPRPMILRGAPTAMGRAQIATEIPPGPLDVAASVTVTYVLGP